MLIRSPGKPSLLQPAISASSIKSDNISNPGVIGIGVYRLILIIFNLKEFIS